MGLILRELEIKDEVAPRAAHLEFPDLDFLIPLDSMKKVIETPWPEHIEDCRKMRLGIDLPKSRVPATFFIAEVNGELVGRASIRHELNKYLFNYGGHIAAVNKAINTAAFTLISSSLKECLTAEQSNSEEITGKLQKLFLSLA